jgi:multiple sugar transport system substrate-binding protein
METIRILGVGDPAVYTYQEKKDTLIRPIEKELGIHIDIDIYSFADYYGKLMDAFKEEEYDIVMVAGHLWLPFFVEEGYLSPVQQEEKNNSLEDVLLAIQREMYYQGRQYLYPSFCDGHILVYRKNRVQKEFKESISILEIIDYLERQEANNQFALKAHPSELFLDTLPYFRALNIQPINELGMVTEDEEKISRLVDLYQKAMKYSETKVRTFGNDEICEKLQSDKVDMAVTWGGQLGAVMNGSCINPHQMGFAALKESWNVTWSFGLNAKSQHKEIAIEVMKKITQKEIDKQVGRKCGNPTRKSNFIEDQENYPWYPIVEKMIEEAKPLPSTKDLPQAISTLTSVLENRLHSEGV